MELILIDDGSTDKSPAICDFYAQKDNRVKVIHKQNEGVGLARNAGLDIAEGKFIAFVDSDDYIAHDMYEKLCRALLENDADLSMCGFIAHDGSKEVIFTSSEEKPSLEVISGEQFLYRLVMPGFPGAYNWLCKKLYKAKLLRNIRFSAGKIHEDTAIIHRLVGECRKIAIIQDELYFYRQHDDSIMGRINQKKFDINVHMRHFKNSKEAFDDRYEYLKSKGMYELAEFSKLRSSDYATMALMLQKVNYLQYKHEVKEIMGTTPLKLMIRLATSKHKELRMRALKLGLIWFRSFFKPFTR